MSGRRKDIIKQEQIEEKEKKLAETEIKTEKEYIEKDIELDQLAFSSHAGRRKLKNEQHEIFAQEYVTNLHIGNAALAAGFAPKSASSQGSRLLKTRKVRDRVNYLMRKRAQRTNIKADDVIREISTIAFSNILDYLKIDRGGRLSFLPEGDMVNAEAIQEISVSTGKVQKKTLKLHDKIRALDMLMRHMDLYDPIKIEIQKMKAELEQAKHNPAQDAETEDDGFIEAMNTAAEDVAKEFKESVGHEGS